MRMALDLAREAESAGEVPAGAVVVLDNRVIGRGRNSPIERNDPTAHAEILALRDAGAAIGNYRQEGATLYSTLEPCVMCAGALSWAQIGRIVYGASDQRRGFNLVGHPLLHPKTKINGGVLENECSSIIKTFFQKKR